MQLQRRHTFQCVQIVGEPWAEGSFSLVAFLSLDSPTMSHGREFSRARPGPTWQTLCYVLLSAARLAQALPGRCQALGCPSNLSSGPPPPHAFVPAATTAWPEAVGTRLFLVARGDDEAEKDNLMSAKSFLAVSPVQS